MTESVLALITYEQLPDWQALEEKIRAIGLSLSLRSSTRMIFMGDEVDYDAACALLAHTPNTKVFRTSIAADLDRLETEGSIMKRLADTFREKSRRNGPEAFAITDPGGIKR